MSKTLSKVAKVGIALFAIVQLAALAEWASNAN